MTEKEQHILVLSSWYPSRNSEFVGNFIQRQAKLISTKYKVTVLYTKSESTIQQNEIIESQTANFREIIVYHPKGKNIFQKYMLQRKAFNEGLNLINGITLIHGHIMLPKGFQFVIAKKIFKCPLIISEQGSYFRSEIRKKRSIFDKITLLYIRNNLNLLTCSSNFLIDDLQGDFPKTKIKILPNHIEKNIFIHIKKEHNKIKQFLHISTLDEKVKNPKGIIDACILLIKKGILNFHLTIISDESTEKWENYSVKNNISQYITFLGPIDWFDLVPYYQKSDAFILFSSYETFSIVLAEAWACGIPTITTSVGIGNNLSKELGIQVEINSPESLANGMIELIENKITFNPTLISKHAEQFSGENVLRIFKELVD